MSAKLIKGLIIDNKEYGEHDLIVKILSNYKIYSVWAPGVRKAQSKNRASLMIGTFGEYEVFVARLNNRMSKLKKGVILKSWDITNFAIYDALKEVFFYLNKIDNSNSELFNFIDLYWNNISSENASYIRTFLMSKILISLGYKPFYDCCFECKSNQNLKNFEFFQGGMSCNIHTKYKQGKTLEELKSFYFLGKSFEEYQKNTSPLLNLHIYKEIKHFISENIV